MTLSKSLNKNILIIIILFFLIFLSILRSLYFAIHYTAPLPGYLVFYDAYQFLNGYFLFKDIVIVYGFLTTIIHYFFLKIFGSFVLSLSIGTAIIYSSTFLIYFFILKNLNFSKISSLIIILLIFIIHPGIVLPWANYISYFFLLIGILLFSIPSSKIAHFYYFGIALGLATLSRQTIFFSILLFILTTFFFNKIKIKRLFIILGLLTIVLIFFSYLAINHLIDSWFVQSFKTWTIFTYKNHHPTISESLGYLNYLIVIKNLLIKLIFSFANFEFKWIFYFLLLISNIGFLIDTVFFKKNYQQEYKLVLISSMSIFLYSEAIHMNDIFRLSTGAIIGLISSYSYLINLFRKIFSYSKKLRKIFFLTLLFILFTLFYTLKKSYHNYKDVLNINSTLSEPKIDFLKYQKFPIEVSFFYEKFDLEIKRMHSLYKVDYNYNFSDNSLLPIISRTKSLQISSFYNLFGLSDPDDFVNLYKYYPHLKFSEIIKKKPNNMMVFVMLKDKNEINKFKNDINFNDFFIFSELIYPLNKNNPKLLILLPKNINKLI